MYNTSMTGLLTSSFGFAWLRLRFSIRGGIELCTLSGVFICNNAPMYHLIIKAYPRLTIDMEAIGAVSIPAFATARLGWRQ